MHAWMHAHILALYSSEDLLSNKVIPEHILMKMVASKRQEGNDILSDPSCLTMSSTVAQR